MPAATRKFRFARDREPVDLTMDDILAARDEGRR